MEADNQRPKEPIKEVFTLTVEDILNLVNSEYQLEGRKALLKQLTSVKVKQHPQLIKLISTALRGRPLTLSALYEEFTMLNQMFRQQQASALIVGFFYNHYKQVVKERDPTGLLYPTAYVNIWRSIPLSCLADYFQSFNLQSLDEDWPSLQRTVREQLLNGKFKDAALYYTLFKQRDQEFERQYLLPKLLKGEDVYTHNVLKLLQKCPELAGEYAGQADPAVAVKVLELAGFDIRKFPLLIEHLQRMNYKHSSRQCKDWWKMEERFAYSPKLIQWYADDFLEGDVRNSVLIRAGLKGGEPKVNNPLFEKDAFTYTEDILQKDPNGLMWKLSSLGVNESDVHFVGQDNTELFKFARQTLLSAELVGFDSEFRATTHKYEDDGVSLIQLSAGRTIFVFDAIAMAHSKEMHALLDQLFCGPITKVGHTIKSDYQQMSKIFELNRDKFRSFVDLAELFKERYPNEQQSSLSFITFSLTGKHISKYEQRSNWNSRPLRKCQLHYAAMDAYICQLLYLKLIDKVALEINKDGVSQTLQDKQPKYREMVRTQNFSYGEEFAEVIKKPKFLVDNMLKRVATFLRNLGLDAQYLSVKDHTLVVSMAEKEGRIILTKDKNLQVRRNTRVPIYLIEAGDSQQMTRQIVKFFNIDMKKLDLLSRCVKCNSNELILMSRQDALKQLQFRYEDTSIRQFWKCGKCHQIYWEGHSYKNAKTRFSDFKKSK